MSGHRLASALIAAFVAACITVPATARVQDVAAAPCQLCGGTADESAESRATSSIRLEVQTRLDFDKVVFNGEGEAVVSLSPEGVSQMLGAASATGASAMPGSVVIRGEPGRQVRVDLPSRIDLIGEFGGAVRIDQIVTDLPSFPRIGDDGSLSFRFGGDVRITGDTDGLYRGSVEFLVDYL